MTLRKVVRIDEERCDGCGLCVPGCAEGALQIIDGKAKLVSEVYCDGLGACLGECPNDAIYMEEREAEAFDQGAVQKHLQNQIQDATKAPLPCGCPGSTVRAFSAPDVHARAKVRRHISMQDEQILQNAAPGVAPSSSLNHWPVQLMLVPVGAPFLQGADLLICADCVPFTVPDFHKRYLEGRSVLVGCPKLDNLELYRSKLHDIFQTSNPKSITVLQMEVPCCTGLSRAVIQARDGTNIDVPVEIHTLGIRGGARRDTCLPEAACAEGGL